MTGWVIYDPEFGVFLGMFLGLGFWSELDPVGQDAAVTFSSDDEAIAFARTMYGVNVEKLLFVQVENDRNGFASVGSCSRAGLPAWDPNPISA